MKGISTMRKSLYLYLRLGVVLLAACSWNQIMGQLTPYYITTFLCYPNEDSNSLCTVSQSGTHGFIDTAGSGYCANYRGRTPPLDVYASAQWNCSNFYSAVVSSYPTPQPNDPYHYAVSSGVSFSGCFPDGYSQQACDVQYNYIRNPCQLAPC